MSPEQKTKVTQTREFFHSFFAKIRCLHCGERFEHHAPADDAPRKCLYEATEFHPNYDNDAYSSHDDINDDIALILNEK